MKKSKVIAILAVFLCLMLNISLVSASDVISIPSTTTQYANIESIPKLQLDKIKAQAEQSERLNIFVDKAESNGIGVEGIYFDEQKNKYILQILNDDQKENLKLINYDQVDVDYEVVKYSKTELENYNLSLSKLQNSNEIPELRGHWIDVKSNKVVALVDNLDIESKLTEFIDKDALQIAKLVSLDFHVKSGDQIEDSEGSCAAAFHGKKGSQNVLVTAGHCGYNAIGNQWYLGSTSIGTFGYKTSGTTKADAGYIVLNSSSHIEVTETISGAVIAGANDAGNEVVGDWIYMSAPYTGYILQGQVQAKGVELNAGGHYGFTKLTDIRLTNSTSEDGDSGAPVMKFKFNSSKDRWEYIIQGVNGGTVTYDLNGTVKTFEWYSAYKNVYNALGLSSIYVAS